MRAAGMDIFALSGISGLFPQHCVHLYRIYSLCQSLRRSSMDRIDRTKYWFWVGLILISIFYCLYYVLFLYRMAVEMPIRRRHVIKFIFILLVYGAGLTSLRRWGMPWMIRVWHLCYLFIVVALLLLGGYEWANSRAPIALRSVADSLQVLLVSPILYVGMRIIDAQNR